MEEESFQNNFFDTEYLKADLKGRSVRGGAATIAAQGTTFFLGMASTVVLARLLTPQDFGLIAMVTAVTGFVVMFKDMGLSMATVQRAEVNHAQISTLFWINVVLSLGVMLVIAALAPVIAWFYGEPRLTWITLALAGAFIFGGFTIQHQALLRRNMRFGSLALIQIISMSVGIVAAIIAAWYGAGYWALVIMQLTTAITGAIAVWVVCGWRPGLPARRSGVRKMLAFGGNLTAVNVMNYFTRNTDNLLIGKFCGSQSLGWYSKAYGLLLLPIRQITAPLSAVAIPALSRLQDQSEKYRRFYCRGIEILVFAGAPLIVLLSVSADEFISLFLGKQWLDSVLIFRVLSPAALMATTNVATGWVYVSTGTVHRKLRWGIFASIVLCLSIAIGLKWGVLGVALAVSASRVVLKIPGLQYCYRGSPICLRDYFHSIWRPTLTSIAAGLVLYYIEKMFLSNIDQVLIRMVLLSSIYIALYLIFLYTLPGGREWWLKMLKTFKDLRPQPYRYNNKLKS